MVVSSLLGRARVMYTFRYMVGASKTTEWVYIFWPVGWLVGYPTTGYQEKVKSFRINNFQW